jgi:hypothetical protein
MAGKKKSTPIPLQSLDALFGTTSEEQAGIQQIALDNLHPFSNHPFKVLDDDKMTELSESVRTHGVLVPGIVRIKDTGGYEIIAGHRRKRACEIAGLKTMPVIIKDLTDDESTVIMVDSNIQREELLISEKAFAYKLKYDALKRHSHNRFYHPEPECHRNHRYQCFFYHILNRHLFAPFNLFNISLIFLQSFYCIFTIHFYLLFLPMTQVT